MSVSLSLRVLPDRLAVCRLSPHDSVPEWAAASGFTSITRTAGELSIVCSESAVPAGTHRESGWRALEVAGPLEFALTGILAAIAGPLAEARISIFAVSTFDTDYILVRESALPQALDTLRTAGHRIDAA